METIDLNSRAIFGDENLGIAVLVDEPNLKIQQVGLEPRRYVSAHIADTPATIQILHGRGVFSSDGESLEIGTDKLLRIRHSAHMGVANPYDNPLSFLLICTPLTTAPEPGPEQTLTGRPGSFFIITDFAPPKPGKLEAFQEWFHHSNEVFAKHRGFLSRTLLGPIEGGNRYATLVEHESKETFMDMHLSDDREVLFQQVEPLILGPSKPSFYELLLSCRKKF